MSLIRLPRNDNRPLISWPLLCERVHGLAIKPDQPLGKLKEGELNDLTSFLFRYDYMKIGDVQTLLKHADYCLFPFNAEGTEQVVTSMLETRDQMKGSPLPPPFSPGALVGERVRQLVIQRVGANNAPLLFMFADEGHAEQFGKDIAVAGVRVEPFVELSKTLH